MFVSFYNFKKKKKMLNERFQMAKTVKKPTVWKINKKLYFYPSPAIQMINDVSDFCHFKSHFVTDVSFHRNRVPKLSIFVKMENNQKYKDAKNCLFDTKRYGIAIVVNKNSISFLLK
jgi:hypothetical protein